MNFLKKIFVPTILVISFLLLLYTFYKSEIVWDGNNRKYYKPYYLIFSTLIFFSISFHFVNQKFKEYIIISAITIFVSLYFLEAFLIYSKNSLKNKLSREEILKNKLYENQTGKKWDRRSKLEIYKKLKKSATIGVFPNQYLYRAKYSIFPLSSISNYRTIHCNENGYYSIYHSDRYGFNNPDSEWDKKEIDYLLIGDSFTHGACVNRPNDIGSVIRSLSNKTVLNLGQSGNGPIIEYATLREYLSRNVKNVLWIYYRNDLDDLINEKKWGNNILLKYLNDSNYKQNLKSKQNTIDDLAFNFIKEKEAIVAQHKSLQYVQFIKLYNLRDKISQATVKKQFKNTLSIIPQTDLSTVSEFKEIIQLAKEYVEKNNSKFYFVYLPGYLNYRNYKDKNYSFEENNNNYNLIKTTVKELKIPFIDIHKEVFAKEKNPLIFFPFELSAHYNIKGYKKVAETIYKFTKD